VPHPGCGTGHLPEALVLTSRGSVNNAEFLFDRNLRLSATYKAKAGYSIACISCRNYFDVKINVTILEQKTNHIQVYTSPKPD
jgi:hypothetical protein